MSPQDVALLRRWNETRDADAFCEIVERYSGLVYGACLRVLRNPADAEDVAQECFLKVSEAETAPTTSLPGWLHTMATRRALNRLRSEKRRTARDTAFGAENSEAREYAFDEVQEFVDEAIAKLPDDVRLPLVEHYLMGRTYEAIGDELGVTRQAVSQRVQKGVEEVRNDLRGRGIQISSGALPTGLAGLAGIVATEGLRKALRSAAIGGLDAKSLAISTSTVGVWAGIAIVALAIVGGLLTAWEVRRGPSEPPNRIPTSAAVGVSSSWNGDADDTTLLAQAPVFQPIVPVVAQASTAAADPRTPDFTAASLERPLPEPGVGSILLYMDSADAVGADVTIFNVHWKPWEKVPSSYLTYTGKIPESRMMIFRNLPLGGYHVRVRKGDRGSTWNVVLDESIPGMPLNMTMLGVSGIQLRVQDEAGKPISPATSYVYQSRLLGLNSFLQQPRTKSQELEPGLILYPDVLAGPINFYVVAPGFAPGVSPWVNTRDKPTLVELKKGGTFECVVVNDETGEPVQGAIVHLEGDWYRVHTHAWTDENGVARIPDLANGAYRVRLHDDELVLKDPSLQVAIEAGKTTRLDDVRVVRGPDIVGRVYDEDTGEGIPNVRLKISADTGAAIEDVVTDIGGHYALMNTSFTRYRVAREAANPYGAGAGPQSLQISIAPGGMEGTADFPLRKGIPIAGRVVDGNGRPVAGAVIRAGSDRQSMVSYGLSDRNGRFVINRIEGATSLYIYARPQGYGAMVDGPFEIPAEGRNDIQIRVPKEAYVIGTVRIDGKLAPGQTYVYCDPHDPESELGRKAMRGHYTYTSPLGGRFMLSFLGPGTYDLRVAPPGGNPGPVVATVTLREGEMLENFNIDYRTSGLAITGMLTDRNGGPIAGASIYASTQNGGGASARSEIDGSFSLPGLVQGKYLITATHKEYSETMLEEVAAPAQGLRIVMPAKGAAIGTVRSAMTGAPVQQFQIAGLPGVFDRVPLIGSEARSFSSDTGEFKMDGLEANGSTLVILAPGYAPGIVQVPQIREGQMAGPYNVTLQAATKLTGQVLDTNGKPVAGVVIRTANTMYDLLGNAVNVTRTDANGRFATDKLQTGEAQFIADHPTYIPALFSATLQPGATIDVNVIMEAGGLLEGVVYSKGEPAPNKILQLRSSNDGITFDQEMMMAFTDQQGKYRFQRIPAGEYMLQIMEQQGNSIGPMGQGMMVAIDSFGTQELDLSVD